MKLRNFIWIGVFLFTLISCNEPESIVESAATIELEFPIALNELKSNQLSYYTFSGYATFCLAKNDNVKNCPNNVLKVMPGSGAILSIPLDTDISNVSSLIVSWGYALNGSDQYNMLETIELMNTEVILKNGSLDYNLDNVLLPLINNRNLSPYGFLKITINGVANFNPTSSAKIDVPIIIEHEELSARFSLF